MATLNLAQAQKMDLTSAAQLVGKSIGTATNALARQGIELKDNMTTSEKYTAVIDQLNTKFGGQAEAAAMGLGAVKQLQNNFSDVLETIGEKLSPVITAGARALSDWVIKLGQSKQFVEGLEGAVTFLTKGFFVLKNSVVAVGGVIGTGLAAAMESVSLLTQGEFTRAKEVAALGITEMGAVIKDSKATLDEELAMLDAQKVVAEEQKRAEELLRLQTSETNKTKVSMDEATKRLAVEKKASDEKKKLEDKTNQEMIASRSNFLGHMAAMQGSSNAALMAIGKAAAIAQIMIATHKAAADGFAWGMAMGGPPLAAAFKTLAYVSGAAQVAQVAGIKLAEGGIVKATPGGVPAIIGEGGRDEAVIPLEDGRVPGGRMRALYVRQDA
jgi:hypothetical protein